MKLTLQETPQAPSYASPNIEIPANIATPQATMKLVNDQQTELNAVNTLTSGGRRQTKRQQKSKRRRRQYKHKSFIRTYKGHRLQQQKQKQEQEQQQKGGAGAVPEGQIPITQVGSTCSSGTQCAGAQNANFVALKNQAESNSINDQYIKQSGGKKTQRNSNKTRRQDKYNLTDAIASNIKKVIQRIFS